jgi:YVTN family beta-propeller protein
MKMKLILIAAFLPLVAVLAQQQQTPPPDAPPTPPADAAPKKMGRGPRPPRVPAPGVSTPGVKRDMTTITPIATFETGGNPDWQAVTDDAVWVSVGRLSTVFRLDVNTNQIAAKVPVGKSPCSGLIAGFGSIWVPSCGDKTLGRVDIKTNTLVETIPVGPGESEGGIAASPDAIWLVTDKTSKLSRIDPKTNTVVATVDVPANSASVVYGDGAVWVTSPASDMVTRVDATTNKVTDSIPVGKGPRFVTYGGGAVWTLNQRDGTVSRIDTKTHKLVLNIEAGMTGTGGEIGYGLGHVWATLFDIPICEIDPATNSVVRQFTGGANGDSIRAAHGSVFLSNLRGGTVWRIDPSKF